MAALLDRDRLVVMRAGTRRELALLGLLGASFIGGAVFAHAAGATDLHLEASSSCMADGSTYVEWTLHNPTGSAFAVDAGTPGWPTEVAPGATATAAVIVPPGPRPLDVWADVSGSFVAYPGDQFYGPGPDGRLPWSEGQRVTLTEDTCASSTTTTTAPAPAAVRTTTTTAAPTTSVPPNSVPILQQAKEATTSTSVAAGTAGASSTTASVGTGDTSPTGAPPVEQSLPDTGSATRGLVAVGVALIGGGAILSAGGRRPRS